MLKIEHLRKRFGNHVVLDDVSLEVKPGEVLSIIGQSGMGKSLILKHIVGLLIPDGGRIILDGKEISSPTKKPAEFVETRRRFGMLFQGAALFDSKSVGENLAFPLRERTEYREEEIERMIVEALEMVGLQSIQEKMPSELSGGMRSRVGLARALVMRPEIMLYDEPTSALDPIMSDKINDLILELKQKLNMTSIVVTHDMNSAYKVSDTIAMIYEGKIIFHGTPAEIRASRNPYIQQFISGRRKLHYAMTALPEEKAVFDRQVDISSLQRKMEVTVNQRRDKELSRHDSVTGLPDENMLRMKLSQAMHHARAGRTSFAFALVGIDFHEELVKQYGENFARDMLLSAAGEVTRCIRAESDFAARLRTDTFGIIIVSSDIDSVRSMMERIRRNVQDRPFKTPDGEIVQMTVSVGVTVYNSRLLVPDALIHGALRALGAAQRGGHNRVEMQ